MTMLGADCSNCCKCESRSCTRLGGVLQGDCEDATNCCCVQDPEGGCFDPSVLDENGELTVPIIEAPLRGHCLKCCTNEVIFSMLAFRLPGNDPNDRIRSEVAGEWVENVKALLEANGYSNVNSYNVFCSKGGTAEEETNNVVWLRACCDGTFSEDTGDCLNANDVAPADNFGLSPAVPAPLNNPCVGLGAGYWIPLCLPNPLP